MKKTCFTLLAIIGILLAACGPVISFSPPGPATAQPTAENQFDFGDAPESYAVLLTDNGGRTSDPYQFWLGPTNSTASLETDAKLVDRDEAEDGLELSSGGWMTIRVNGNFQKEIYLNVLVDLNGDRKWEDREEWYVRNFPSPVPFTYTFNPGELDTWIRILVSDEPITTDSWNGSGYWRFGEVEDYQIVWESYETPTPWTPTNTPTATFTPTEKVIYTTPGGNSIATPTDTATPTTTEKTICTKCGGPTNTPTPTDSPPPAEAPIWSGNVCGGTDFYSDPGGHFIRRIDQSEHIYMLVMLSDGWTKIQAGNDIGWIWVDWRVAEFGYDGHPCQ